MDVAQVADRLALSDLADGYADAADRRDPVAFAALFLPHATLTIVRDGAEPSVHTGHDQLARIPEMLGRYRQTLHVVTNHHVTDQGRPGQGPGPLPGPPPRRRRRGHHRPGAQHPLPRHLLPDRGRLADRDARGAHPLDRDPAGRRVRRPPPTHLISTHRTIPRPHRSTPWPTPAPTSISSTSPSSRPDPDASSAWPTAADGSTCGGAPPAATSAAATRRRPGTARPTPACTGHAIAQSYEPGEDWLWCFVDEIAFEIPELDAVDLAPRRLVAGTAGRPLIGPAQGVAAKKRAATGAAT